MDTIKKNIVAIIIFILFFSIGLAYVITYPKLEIQQYINSFYYPAANTAFKFLTRLAEGWFTVPLLIFLLFYNWRKGLYIGLAYGIASLLVAVLKRFVFANFKRPHGLKQLIEDENYNWLKGVEMPSNLSFPSGHTTVAFCIFFSLALIIPNKKVGTILVVIAVLIGFSRTYLSYHFLMDLVAGSFLGVATALGMYLILKKKLKL